MSPIVERRRRDVDPRDVEDVDVLAGPDVAEIAESPLGAIGLAESRSSSDICM